MDFVGIAADKKERDINRFLEKGESRADTALAFDQDWILKVQKRSYSAALLIPPWCTLTCDSHLIEILYCRMHSGKRSALVPLQYLAPS